jgi:hypothetical protein
MSVFPKLSGLINDHMLYTTLYLPVRPGKTADLGKQTSRRSRRCSSTQFRPVRVRSGQTRAPHLLHPDQSKSSCLEHLTRRQMVAIERWHVSARSRTALAASASWTDVQRDHGSWGRDSKTQLRRLNCRSHLHRCRQSGRQLTHQRLPETKAPQALHRRGGTGLPPISLRCRWTRTRERNQLMRIHF